MIVAIQKGLEGVREKLIDLGYQVVYYDEYIHPIDAYIYAGYSGPGDFNNMVPISSMSNVSHGDNWGSGVMFIDAYNKNINEIDYMLRSRCYSAKVFSSF